MTTNTETRRLLIEADRILKEARGAIRKIEVERQRGMGYYHAEVDWLVQERENIEKLRADIRAFIGGRPHA
jgi:hypothetical protein